MQTVTVPLLCSYEHEGRYVAAGESITVTPLEALALARRNIVSLTKTYTHRGMVADVAMVLADASGAYAPIADMLVPDAQKPRRRRRRTPVSDTPEKPKRRYRRRDLTAED